VTPDHCFQIGDRVRILRGNSHPLEVLIEHDLPLDEMVFTVIRLLPLDPLGPAYHLQAPDGTLGLVHESQLAAAEG
jgi:hypothetical protein